MGCSNSNEISQPSATIQPGLIESPQNEGEAVIQPISTNPVPNDLQIYLPQMRELSTNLLENFIIAKVVKQKLSELALTSAQLKEVIESVVALALRLEESQNQEEKQLVYQIVAQTSNIGLEKLKYYKVLQRFKQNFKQENIKPESLSRIYHLIANAQKEKEVKNQYSITHQPTTQEQRLSIKLNYLQTNDYNVLSAQQVEEAIKLEAVGQKIENFSSRFKLKLDSIRNQSDDMSKLLAENFFHYQQQFKSLKYDFEISEVMKVAEISRKSCNYSDNGVVMLLIYLINACQKQEKNGKSVQTIQQLMGKSIESISKQYPPGQGLKQQQQYLKEALRKLQLKSQFHYKSYPLSSQNKQKQLEEIIMLNASIAKTYKNDFENFLQQTCVELAIKTLMGLKLNPDRPNQKAMIRIKEKMLIGKSQSSQTTLNKGTVKATINFEEEEYKRKVDQLIRDKKDITFKISDMLRGKCVFVSIPDIILTIQKIKSFVVNDERKRFRIIEIESRFTNNVPISDVTLKIAINEEIVTELQLTIQSNAATYTFAHKVYQLQRAKMFSKIKIVHNYFEQFNGEFKELVTMVVEHAKKTAQLTEQQGEKLNKKIVNKQNKQLNLSLKENYSLINRHSAAIQQYFSISIESKTRNFNDLIVEVIAHHFKKDLPEKLAICTDQQLQGMMLALFNKQMGSWASQLGKQIDSIVNSNCSQLVKATLLFFFFRSFQISKEIFTMLGFYRLYLPAGQNESKGKDFFLIYLQQNFSISRPFDFTKTNARIFYLTKQLQNMTIIRKFVVHPGYQEKYQNKFVVETMIKGVVVQDDNSEKVKLLMQLVNIYCIVRDYYGFFYDQFQLYYLMLMNLLKEKPILDDGVSAKAKLLKVHKLLQYLQPWYDKPQPFLEQLKDYFKKKEEMQNWLQCEFLQAETLLLQSNMKIEIFQERYEKATQAANALGLELKGAIAGYSQWRIYLWIDRKYKYRQQQKKYLLHHLGKALIELSRIEGEKLFFKIKTALQQGLDVSEMKIMDNFSIRYIDLFNQKLQQSDCQKLALAKWINLNTLNLSCNKIRTKGCQYLVKSNWNNLRTLILEGNQILDEGCAHLAKADWKNLTELNLQYNKITEKGCAHLAQANWKNLNTLDLSQNQISDEGCTHLTRANWKNLTRLSLGSCKIRDFGCQQLAKADWKNLLKLDLRYNNISKTASSPQFGNPKLTIYR